MLWKPGQSFRQVIFKPLELGFHIVKTGRTRDNFFVDNVQVVANDSAFQAATTRYLLNRSCGITLEPATSLKMNIFIFQGFDHEFMKTYLYQTASVR